MALSISGITLAGKIKLSKVLGAIFSPSIYTGNNSSQIITTGLDSVSSTEVVITKSRSAATNSSLVSSNWVSGTYSVSTNTTAANITPSGITSFSSTGYTLGAVAGVNANAATYVSWAFKEQAAVFSEYHWQGDGGSSKVIPHALTVTPELSIITSLTSVSLWPVVTPNSSMLLNTSGSNNSLVAGTSVGTTYTSPVSVAVSPDGISVYTGSNGADFISTYTRNDITGALTAGSVVASGQFPNNLIVSPDNKNLYAVNNGSSTISVYTRNTSTGAITLHSSPTATTGASGAAISADGAYYYTANSSSNNVTMFSRNATTGALTSIGNVATGASTTPYRMDVSPDGKNVYTSNNGNGTVSIFARNTSTGVLTLSGSVAAGTGSLGIVVSPDNANVYVVNNTASTISVYARNTTTGALTLSDTLATGTAPRDVAISPDGESVYVTCATANALSVYNRNTSTGALTTAGSIATGTSPFYVRVSSDNNNVYVPNYTATTLSVFNRSSSPITSANSSTFTIDKRYNTNSVWYSAYLFATLAGVSKVGRYIGDGTSSKIIDCGFSSSARFILIKREDIDGDWYVWDSARGISASGNSPHLSLNSSAAEVSTDNSVGTDSTGFVVRQTSATNINVASAPYTFLALA